MVARTSSKAKRIRTGLPLPAFRPPQLATLQRDVPEDDTWLYELKYNGYRCQAAIGGLNVKLYNIAGEDYSQQFGHVIPAMSELTYGTLLLDGEICAIDEDGRTDAALLKRSLGGRGPLVFFAFDLLEQDGEDVSQLPQVERKRRLAALLADQPVDSPLLYSQHVVGNGRKVFDAVRAGGFDGIVAKWPTARYYGGGRSTAWLEIKVLRQQEFVVIGWTPDDKGDGLRGLVLGTYERGELVYRGEVETGLLPATRRKIIDRLTALPPKRRPRVEGLGRGDMRTAHWVQPRLLAQVEFIDVLADGTLKRAAFKSIREDSDARHVRLEFSGS